MLHAACRAGSYRPCLELRLLLLADLALVLEPEHLLALPLHALLHRTNIL
jgi:hypothetical protein